MTLITPDEGPTGLGTSVTSLERQLTGIKTDLEALQDRLRADDLDALKDSTRMMSDIRNWIRLAIEMEMKLEQHNKREKGIVNGYRPINIPDEPAIVRPFVPPVPVTPLFLDLPLLTGGEVPHAPHLAVTGTPWPGSAALYASDSDANYRLNRLVEARARVGVMETALSAASSGLIDRGEGVTVRMLSGQLESVQSDALLGGANLCAIGDGTPEGWEVMQFRDADLIGNNTYTLSHRLRGQLGTENAMRDEWPAGSYLVMIDGIPAQIELNDTQRRRARHYRIGPAGRALDDPSYKYAVIAFEGIGLRPLSPVHIQAETNTAGDTHLRWIRRTREDGDRWETPDVPLAEESEQYIVRVLKDGVIMREDIQATPNWAYTAAAKQSDGVSGGYEFQVAQVSAKFGAGVFATHAVAG